MSSLHSDFHSDFHALGMSLRIMIVSKEDAMIYAKERGLAFIGGEELLEAWWMSCPANRQK